MISDHSCYSERQIWTLSAAASYQFFLAEVAISTDLTTRGNFHQVETYVVAISSKI